MKNRAGLKRPERVKDYEGQLICGKVALDFALKAKEVVSSWDTSLQKKRNNAFKHANEHHK